MMKFESLLLAASSCAAVLFTAEAQMQYAAVSDYGVVKATTGNKLLPKELWIDKAEAAKLTAQNKAELDAMGYVSRGLIHPGHYFVNWTKRYLVHRLCVDEKLSFAEIEHDWCAQFGAASEIVKRYYAQIRSRCDKGFVKLLAELKENDIQFLDDSHFSRIYHKLHTEADLLADLKLLEDFDASVLTEEARKRFNALKINARHYILARKAIATESQEDKQNLLKYRIANKASLGTAWAIYWSKGEFWLWNESPEEVFYENSAIVRYADRIETALATEAVTPADAESWKIHSILKNCQ